MATFFVDYEGGNDGNAGTSFALRWKTLTNGATAARIAPGDTIRVMASPDPTSLGVTGAWTDGPLASTQAITSSTNATPIVITKVAHGYLNGDTLIVSGHTTNTNANGTWTVANKANDTLELQGSVGNGVGGASGTMRKMNNAVVTLSAAVNKNIALPVDGGTGGQGSKTNWTASANVTCSVTTADFRQGGECQSIALAAGFTTGLAAFLALPGVTDYSAYQQLTFWIKQTAGTIGAAGATRIRLCTDAIGLVPVNTFDVPNLVNLNSWTPVTVNLGSALSAIVSSVSFDVVTDNGAQTFLIDNIFAVKSVASADSMSLNSLLSKKTAGESWLAIQSIVGTRVMLDQLTSTIPSSSPQRGYSGTTEIVTTYIREPLQTLLSTNELSINDSGTLGSQITYSFGWDSSSMSSVTGETWYTGRQGNIAQNGLITVPNPTNYISIDGVIGVVRYFSGMLLNNAAPIGINFDFGTSGVHANNNTGPGILCPNTRNVTGLIASARNNGSNASISNQINGSYLASLLGMHGNTFSGVTIWGVGRYISYAAIDARNNGSFGIQFRNELDEVVISSLVTSGNVSGGIGEGGVGFNGTSAQLGYQSTAYVTNANIAEAVEVAAHGQYTDARVISANHDLTSGNTQIFTDGGRIASELTVRHTASGLAWSLSVTSASRASNYPLSLEIAKMALSANVLATVSIWLRRTNTGLTLSLVCKGRQIAGVSSDVSSAMTAAADTWEQRTITFTPTETGVVSITVEAYGGTTFIGYADDFSASQG